MKTFAILVLSLISINCAIAQSAQSNSVPDELIGNWYKGSTSSLAYLDRNTNISDSAGGNGTGLNIKADGTFAKAELVKVGLYSCSTVVFGYKTGKIMATSDTLTFNGAKFYVSYKDSCNPHTNSETNAPPITQEYQYELKTDESGRTLLCLNDGKQDDCFWKEEKE